MQKIFRCGRRVIRLLAYHKQSAPVYVPTQAIKEVLAYGCFKQYIECV